MKLRHIFEETSYTKGMTKIDFKTIPKNTWVSLKLTKTTVDGQFYAIANGDKTENNVHVGYLYQLS